MNGPADRAVRLLLFLACGWLAIDLLRLVSDSSVTPEPVADLSIDLNSDPPERLRLLPGIGPVIARNVIEERARRPFRDAEDFVARIRGIGPAFVANFGPWMRFGGQSIASNDTTDGRISGERTR